MSPRHPSLWVLALGAALLGATCERPETPTLDVRQSGDVLEVGAANCVNAKQLPPVQTGDALVVLHQLPRALEQAPGELELTVETVCETLSFSPSHDDDGLAVATFAAPEGAECGVIVSAEIANASDRCVLAGPEQADPEQLEAACNYVCPEPTEAGTGDTTDTGTGDTGGDTTGG